MLRISDITRTILQRLTEYPDMIKNCISFNNCIVQITKTGKVSTTAHTPTIFTTKYFNYNYNKDAKCPMFLKFLDQILDKESQITLQQAWGYVLLSSDISIEKIFCMSGCGANGKTVCEEIATAVFGGSKNVSNASISMLASDANMRAESYDKMLVYSDEMGRISGSDLDTLKSMASNQSIDCKLMRKDRFVTKWKPRIMFNTNRLPTSENTHGFFRRIVIIPFNNIIPKAQQDITLASKIIKKELYLMILII
jgi:putative DNA primase/helicase